MTLLLTEHPEQHDPLTLTPHQEGWQVTCTRCHATGQLATHEGAVLAAQLHQCGEET